MKLVFATHNKNKVKEVKKLIPNHIQLLSLEDIDCFEDIPETSDTIEGNALQKARFISEKYGLNCFADDTGLEVSALNGEPGVYSARYAGEKNDAEANMNKLLSNLKGAKNKKARFKTVIALILNNEEEYLFEGIVNGHIIEEKRGGNGFGYDPVFVPEGFSKTFAELSLDIKNKISHRGIAVNKLISFLEKS